MADNSVVKRQLSRGELALLQKRREIMGQSSETALDTILNSNFPAKLIQSFSEEDLYFLINEIGYGDALPVLSMATSDQWGYMLDVEVWTKDRVNIDSVTRWLNLLLLADGNRTVQWLITERLEFIELYLFKNIDVVIREENQDPSELPDEFFTYDDYFYIRVVNKDEQSIPEDEEELLKEEDREAVVRGFIEKLVDMDHGLYQRVMLESMSVVPAEIEEEDYRLRNVRLAEKGFQAFDDAIRVFTPLSLEMLSAVPVDKTPHASGSNDGVMAPIAHFNELDGKNHFTDALALVDNEQDLEQLQTEFALLCNLIISAEQKKIRERKELGGIVKKACGYVSIGLESITGQGAGQSLQDMVALIKTHRLETLFRAGYGLVTDLKRRAEKIKKEGWFRAQKLPLSFWGEEWLGVFGGLLVKHPLFFDNYKTGTLYREFSSMDDIVYAGKVLDDIKGFDDLLSVLSPDIACFEGYFLTCYNLMLTLWINHKCGRSAELSGPIPFAEFREIFPTIWEAGDRGFGKGKGTIAVREKTELLQWLAGQTGFTEVEISERLGRGFEAMFSEIESDYGEVSPKDLNPNYIHHFCISSDE